MKRFLGLALLFGAVALAWLSATPHKSGAG